MNSQKYQIEILTLVELKIVAELLPRLHRVRRLKVRSRKLIGAGTALLLLLRDNEL